MPVESEPASAPVREHDANGHYIHGPRIRPNPLARLIGEQENAPSAPSPVVAHGQMRERRRRALRALSAQQRFLAAVRGEPVGRNRSAA